jgi:Fe2+ transport system protein FeoA
MRIIELRGNQDEAQRAREMGIREGADVKIVQRHPMILLIDGTRVAWRSNKVTIIFDTSDL